MNEFTKKDPITAAALGAAFTVIGVWGLSFLGVEPPSEVVVALTTVVTFITQRVYSVWM